MKPNQANYQYGDKERFSEACRALCGEVPSRKKIGVLSEKTLHSVIKRFIEPNEALQEVKVGNHYADIKNNDGIYEVQTRSFNKLRAKLSSYLETERVTILTGYKVEQQGYRACMALLKMADTYTPERLEAACEKALSYTPRPGYKVIQAILKSGQDKISEKSAAPSDPSPFSFTRGADYYGRGRE